MPLSSYEELRAHLASDLNRSDLTAPIQDAIRLAEAEMSEQLKCREMDNTVPLAIVDGEADIPEDLQSVLSLRLVGAHTTRVEPEGIDALEARRSDVGGDPQTYSMVGEKFVFWPPGTANARLRYRRDVPALEEDEDSNWVLAGHPQTYLYGALYQLHMFLKDDQRAASYKALFEQSIQNLNARDLVSQLPGMTVRPSGQVV